MHDDIESFVNVVLYHGLRYMKHNQPLGQLATIMERVFDGGYVEDDGTASGGEGKFLLYHGGFLDENFAFTDNGPLTLWWKSARVAVREWHAAAGPTTVGS